MQIFEDTQALQEYLKHVTRLSLGGVGFVPTMGALHDGHLSLLRQSKSDNSTTVCSIFVNPTQFDEPDDLGRYPRTLEKDRRKLKALGVEVLFAPPEQAVYPDKGALQAKEAYDFGYLEQVMEGVRRPGHFKGVAQVVERLLHIVRPDRLYLGQKDYQQYCIIKELIRQRGLAVEVVCCPVMREKDGLAMSSRNVHLTPVERRAAPAIYQTLCDVKKKAGQQSPENLRQWAAKKLAQVPAFWSVDYFSIVHAESLRSVKRWEEATNIVACTAVRTGKVRLIDNMFIKGKAHETDSGSGKRG